MKSNIFITGFSGSGKSTVGREVARCLGWRFVGTDDEIVKAQGKPIDAIFSDMGEAGFRRIERAQLAAVCDNERQVVSTGGGIIMDENNVQMMERSGVIVYLEARPEVIHARLETERIRDENPAVRPMIAASDQLERIRSLKAERQSSYSRAHWTVHTDNLTPDQVAEEIIRAIGLLRRPGDDNRSEKTDLAAVVRTSGGDYPVWVGWRILDELGERVKRILKPPAAYVIGDEGVVTHARRAQTAMEAAGIPTHMLLVPPGETSKTHGTAQRAYEWLADRKAERGHMILAVGGGMVGDLAGFVAATYLRGMPLAQVPTSLLAMMDASVGGKVAVDLPQGKNLVGAFYQPRFVLADVQALQTLPKRELASGWAEAIKHGLILDVDLLDAFERNSGPILELEREAATDIIRRSVAIKAGVVSRDEKETLGMRVLLNYGHTIGHALEKVTEYGRLLHGEAVSVGMMGAAYISHAMGLLSEEEVGRQTALLKMFGLPRSVDGVDVDAVAAAMKSDKKVARGTVRWVLLSGLGRAVARDDVPDKIVREALERLVSPIPAGS